MSCSIFIVLQIEIVMFYNSTREAIDVVVSTASLDGVVAHKLYNTMYAEFEIKPTTFYMTPMVRSGIAIVLLTKTHGVLAHCTSDNLPSSSEFAQQLAEIYAALRARSPGSELPTAVLVGGRKEQSETLPGVLAAVQALELVGLERSCTGLRIPFLNHHSYQVFVCGSNVIVLNESFCNFKLVGARIAQNDLMAQHYDGAELSNEQCVEWALANIGPKALKLCIWH